jgi:uncharacterized protein (TIGR00251 family)
MVAKTHKFHDGKRGVALTVRVIPRARKDEIAGILDDGTIKIRLKAPPVDGKANQALLKFLADLLGVPVSRIEIVAGETSRNKLIAVLDVDRDFVQRALQLPLG